jgi:hypothetical protein
MMRAQRIILFLTFATGFAVLSITCRHSQLALGAHDLPPSFADNQLNDRQRVYLDRHTELTKWLIALSYAILAGLVSKRISGSDDSRFSSFSCSLGAVLLLLSLYAGFLSLSSSRRWL